MTDAMVESAAGTPGPADLIEIFYAPGAVFARRRGGQWGLPYIALVVLGVGLFFATKNLMQPVIDAEISRNLAAAAARNHMTVDQMGTAASFAHTVANIGVAAVFVVAPFIIALLLWLVGSIAKVPTISRTALAIATLSMFPRLLGMIAGGIEAAVLPDSAMTSAAAVSFSPARFLGPNASIALSTLLTRFDLFLLWGVVLTAIGVRVAAGGTAKQAWSTAIGVWVIASLPAVWGILRA